MSTLQIPTVTIDDLQAFQAKHFPDQLQHAPAFPDTFNEFAFAEEEDDLGYYPDGVKRTLTEDQIRIFRHSEIHSILRERELEEENEDTEESSGDELLNDNDQKRNDALANSDKAEISNLSSSKDPQLKQNGITTRANANSESGTLSYGEDGTNRNNEQAKSCSASGPAIAERKIISYADD